MPLFTYDENVLEFSDDFKRPLEKRRKFNGTGEDCYLCPDGRVVCDEAKIVAAQRIWKDIAYAPDGKMYKLGLERWRLSKSS
jgi:hypothetical protein